MTESEVAINERSESLGRSVVRALLYFALFAFSVVLATGLYFPSALRELIPFSYPLILAAIVVFLIVDRLLSGNAGGWTTVLHGLLAFVISWLTLLLFIALAPYPFLGYPIIVAGILAATYYLDRGLALGVWLAVCAGVPALARTAAVYTPTLSPLQINSVFSGAYTSDAGVALIDLVLMLVIGAATLPAIEFYRRTVLRTGSLGGPGSKTLARVYLSAGVVLLASVTMFLVARGMAADSVRVLNHDRHAHREHSVVNLSKELRSGYTRVELEGARGSTSDRVAGLLKSYSNASQQNYYLLIKNNDRGTFRFIISSIRGLEEPNAALIRMGTAGIQTGARAELARFISLKDQNLSIRSEAAEVDLLNIDDRSWYSIGGPPSTRTVFAADSSGDEDLIIAASSSEQWWWLPMRLDPGYLAGALYPLFPFLFFIWVLAASLFLLVSEIRAERREENSTV